MNLQSSLIQLGFSEAEVAVYNVGNELGEVDLTTLEQETGLTKLRMQSALNALQERGLVTMLDKNGREFVQTESPQKLIAYTETLLKQSTLAFEQLKEQALELEGKRKAEKPIVRFYEGKEGVKSMLNEFNEMESKHAYLFYSPELVRKLLTKEELSDQKNQRVSKGIRAEGICFTNEKNLKSVALAERHEIDYQEYPFSVDVEIYDNKLAITFIKDKPYGLIIENADIAESFRSIFRLVKKQVVIEKEERAEN